MPKLDPTSATTSDPGADAVETIVELFRQLSPAQRRRLARRLRASGLLPRELQVTDRNRLRVAPALGQPAPAQPLPLPPTPRTTANTAPAVSLRMAPQGNNDSSRAGSKIVLGAPSIDAGPPDPHGMAPLPGQAPERPIQIIFDGGSKGNPGYGYGSYALRWPGHPQQIVQLQFGEGVTNNEAEYDTLIAALEAVQRRLGESGADPVTARLDIRGDSQLVINQVLGDWKTADERMRRRRDRVRELLAHMGTWQLAYHARENSVRVLGH
jgi:ribonuclease HI